MDYGSSNPIVGADSSCIPRTSYTIISQKARYVTSQRCMCPVSVEIGVAQPSKEAMEFLTFLD